MRESLGKVTFMIKKDQNFSEWYNTIIRQAEIIDDRFNIKGFVVYLPYGMKMVKRIYEFFEEKLESNGHQPVLFPLLIPEENLQREAEHIGFKAETFWVTMGGDEQLTKKYALRPTSETAFYYMYSIWIRGISDLPLKLYQSVAVYRHETKATKPLIRGREFLWIETHDVFATKDEALQQVEEDKRVMKEVLEEKLGIPVMFIKRPQWDKFRGAVNTFAADAVMPDGSTLQVGSTHYLGQNFSKVFNIGFDDKDGMHKLVEQTCFGPGISRILAAVISIHGDDSGLILPISVAPIQVVIVPIPGEGVLEYARLVKRVVSEMGYKVELDESDETPGSKFYKWEFMGVPLRFEIGPKELSNSSVTIFDRLRRTRQEIELDDLREFMHSFERDQVRALFERAREVTGQRIAMANDMSEARRKISERKSVLKVPMCSTDLDGESCGAKIEEELGLRTLGEELDSEKPSEGQLCIICGKKANCLVYLAESY